MIQPTFGGNPQRASLVLKHLINPRRFQADFRRANVNATEAPSAGRLRIAGLAMLKPVQALVGSAPQPTGTVRQQRDEIGNSAIAGREYSKLVVQRGGVETDQPTPGRKPVFPRWHFQQIIEI